MLHSIVFPLIYGLIIFFLGMKLMEASLYKLSGPLLLSSLNRATATPLKGMLFSTGMTAVLQSSTAVTVLTIGLVNANLLGYARTLGIILGSNVGTTVTTELLSLKIGKYAVPMLLFFISCWIVCVMLGELKYVMHSRHSKAVHTAGYISFAGAGFSMVMLGILMMQRIGPALEQGGVFPWFVQQASHSVWWGMAAGACLTAIVHSSAAVIGMAISLAATGALPPEIGIAIVLGSNVGTCVTAWMAAIGGSKAGQFVAWSHIILNVAGALLFAPLISLLYQAAALFTTEPGAQIAHAQTIFNIVCSLLALPLCYLKIWKRLEP
ncbi:Na/Pi cotransporter family protein [Paenibacillus provencensis]|uniref:Na/Pi cotransporter family protein n=1 Tax=Paenibacillus provencensis TaxID=441151 RepID=A0ABW3PSB8_9BACL|nr:Na/Pi symporter [Paenibacillus sp. MER 78]MCM3126189.1 Na/Pi symporter [Paenibacillus sp. MER 78]